MRSPSSPHFQFSYIHVHDVGIYNADENCDGPFRVHYSEVAMTFGEAEFRPESHHRAGPQVRLRSALAIFTTPIHALA